MSLKITANPEDWKAWFNKMPKVDSSSIPTLHVKGTIDVGNESDDASLEFVSWEKSSPPNLILRITPKMILVPRQPGDTKIELLYPSQEQEPIHLDQNDIGTVIIQYPDHTQVVIDSFDSAV